MSEFAAEVSKPEPPRDHRGQFIAAAEKPQPMFASREIEGDPATGDTSDGGADPRYADHERRIANGWPDERQGRASNAQERTDGAASRRQQLQEGERDRVFDADQSVEQDREFADAESGEVERGNGEGSSELDAEGQEKYEVTVDGATHEVTLQEALNGYVRQATFHTRMQNLANVQAEIGQEVSRLRQNWAMWDQARQAYEEDVANMIPREPDWDAEFRANPLAARDRQKTYALLYEKLAASRQVRMQRQAQEAEEAERQLAIYAERGLARFLFDNKIKTQEEKDKNLRSMRRTAETAGFSEQEIATVFDPRMLTVLLKASKYDRMVAAQPRAVVPGKGRTIPPGAATPLGNAHRKGIDEAQRRLASSGSLDDAADVFRRMF